MKIFIALDTRGPELRINCKNSLQIAQCDKVSIKCLGAADDSKPNSTSHIVGVDINSF